MHNVHIDVHNACVDFYHLCMINSSAHCVGKLVHGGVTQILNVFNSFEVIFIQLYHIHIKVHVIGYIISWAVYKSNNTISSSLVSNDTLQYTQCYAVSKTDDCSRK